MYQAPYGFQNAAGPGAFNGAAPPQGSHLQPGPAPNPNQPMMYNPQQFPMGAQGPFPGGPNMMPGAGAAGMMQNAGMPHMAANGQSKSAISSPRCADRACCPMLAMLASSTSGLQV
jgi:hypothetical protein